LQHNFLFLSIKHFPGLTFSRTSPPLPPGLSLPPGSRHSFTFLSTKQLTVTNFSNCWRKNSPAAMLPIAYMGFDRTPCMGFESTRCQSFRLSTPCGDTAGHCLSGTFPVACVYKRSSRLMISEPLHSFRPTKPSMEKCSFCLSSDSDSIPTRKGVHRAQNHLQPIALFHSRMR